MERIIAASSSPLHTSCGESPWSEWPNPSVWPSSCANTDSVRVESQRLGVQYERNHTSP